MQHSHASPKDIFGYILLVSSILFLAFAYKPSFSPESPLFAPTIFALAGSAAVIAMTISIFWLWKPERVDWLEKHLGIIGHIPHCGYCLSLWISVLYISIFQINFFIQANPLLNFFLSWWALSFCAVLCFELITILWFKKVQLEFHLRDLYKNKRSENNNL